MSEKLITPQIASSSNLIFNASAGNTLRLRVGGTDKFYIGSNGQAVFDDQVTVGRVCNPMHEHGHDT